MKLIHGTAHGTEELDVTHAVPSARARVAISRIVSNVEMSPEQKSLAEKVLIRAKERGEDDQELVRELISSGEISIDDLIGMMKPDVANVENQQRQMIEMFRIAVDQRQMTTEWKSRIADDEFMFDQDITEVEAFVTSFRTKLGV